MKLCRASCYISIRHNHFICLKEKHLLWVFRSHLKLSPGFILWTAKSKDAKRKKQDIFILTYSILVELCLNVTTEFKMYLCFTSNLVCHKLVKHCCWVKGSWRCWVKSNKAHAQDPILNRSDREFNYIVQKRLYTKPIEWCRTSNDVLRMFRMY